MRFYGRQDELAELRRIQALAFSGHSRMTVVTGRRRIGKTSLITQATQAGGGLGGKGDSRRPTLYLFVSRKSEAQLCHEFAEQASAVLGTYIPSEVTSFPNLFRALLEIAEHTPYNLVIDEFQEFDAINRSVFSGIQNHWDQLRLRTKLNLIISGSVHTLMHRIFRDSKEPLFGRADGIIELKPFLPSTLRQIIQDGNAGYSNDDLLALFSFTGGVPKYVELFFDNQAMGVEEMVAFMTHPISPFIDEGRNLLITEFGRNYGVYFSILEAVAEGANTQSRIEDRLQEASLSGHLKRLVEDYGLLTRRRPILAKATSQTVRFELEDNFLHFWFAYFGKHRPMVEIGNLEALRGIILGSYPTYSGLMLERYFKQQLAETKLYRDIGSWWEPRGEQNEIDIVALGLNGRQALVAEVKRQRQSFRLSLLEQKARRLQAKSLPGYDLELRCLTLDDM